MPPASSRADGLSRAVDAVLERGLAKDADDRWESATQFVDAAGAHRRARARGGGAADAAPVRPQAAPRPPRSRTPRRAHATPTSSPRRRREPWSRRRAPRRHPRRRGRRPAANGSGDGRGTAAPRAATQQRAAPLLAGLAGAGADRGDRRASRSPPAATTSRRQPRAQNTPEATATAEKTRGADRDRDRGARPTRRRRTRPETATAAPTDTPTPDADASPASGKPDLKAATQAQLAGYNARRAGDYQTALAKAREAQQLCGSAKELSPCGYALFEEGAALIALGQPDAAIPILQRRLTSTATTSPARSPRRSRRRRRPPKKAGRPAEKETFGSVGEFTETVVTAVTNDCRYAGNGYRDQAPHPLRR